ncbi:MAG: beta-N-acetylhexosaminidase [Proteobacteria bacterium]|nr:beta-N-acetylhexosaminidase [Pseudomonadota bacterium]MBU1687495.1 beta-N-acetylhexosaminidase [Pseudomonadota bacterium]
MIGLPGLILDDSTSDLIENHGINNFILFSRNIDTPEQLRRLCTALHHHCRYHHLPPPLIAIDQEGGTVARLPSPWTRFPDARTLAESPHPETAVREYATICAKELLDVGINFNLAPVLDVSPANCNYFMERRSFSGNPLQVATLGNLIISNMQQEGVAACGKHFPGLGLARLDPHLTLPRVDRPRSEVISHDLPPFRAAIRAEVAAIMTSHTIHPGLDSELPATLSHSILTELLRGELGYNGLIITDDLEMGAIANEKKVAEAAVMAFNAGADLLLICKDHDKIRDTLTTLDKARKHGTISDKAVKTALGRINHVRHQFPLPPRFQTGPLGP